MALYICKAFQPDRSRGRSRAGQTRSNTSSSDCKATATNQMHSNDLEACGNKCCYIWFHSEFSLLFDTFWCRIGLSHFLSNSLRKYNDKADTPSQHFG